MWRRTVDRVLQTFIILAVTYYTLIGGFVTGIREYPWRLATVIITFVIMSSWLLKKLFNREEILRTVLDRPILGLISASVLSAMFSTNPRVSWENVCLNILLALSFYFTLELTLNHRLTLKFINAILIIGTVIAALGLFEYWQWYGGQLLNPANWQSTGLALQLEGSLRIKSVLHNPNYLAYYLLVVLGLALGKTVNSLHWRSKAGWSAYSLLIMTTIVLTRSRGGSLGVIMLFFSFFGLLWFRQLRSQVTKQVNRTQAIAIITAMLTLSVLFTWIIIGRTSFNSASILNERLDFWLASLKMLADYPFTGVGAGAYPEQYLIYRDLSHYGVDFIITHAHNLWFTILAEYGLLGLGAALWTVVVFTQATYHSLKRPLPKTEFIWLVTAIAILVAQAAHNLFDDFLEFPIYTWYTIFMGAICLAPQQISLTPATAEKWPKHTLLATIAGLILVISASGFNRGFAAYHQATLASQENNWAQTVAWLEQAVALDPTNRFYQQQLALGYGWLAETDRELLPKAIMAQQKVIDQNDTYPLDYAHLACLYWEQGDREAAITAMTHAAAIEAPTTNYAGLKSWHTSQVTYQFNLGYYYEIAGDLAQAQSYYQQSMLKRPEIAGSVFWQDTPAREQFRQKIIGELVQAGVSFPTIALINYFAGNYQTLLDLSEAELRESSHEVMPRLMQAVALAEMGRQTEAITILDHIPEDQVNTSAPIYLDLLSRLPDTENQRSQLEKAVQTAAVLGGASASPIIYYYWGQLAEADHDLMQAKSRYQEAIFRATAIDTDYANLVGRRLPLAQEKLPCLLLPYAEQELSAPSLRLAKLYELAGEIEAAKNVYKNLLRYEPYHHVARVCLEHLYQNRSDSCSSSLSNAQ